METIKQYTIESCPPYIEWERISLLQNKNGVLFVEIEEKSFNGKHYIFPLDEIRGIYVIPCNTPYRGEGCVEIYTRMKTFIYKFVDEYSEKMRLFLDFLYKILDMKTK